MTAGFLTENEIIKICNEMFIEDFILTDLNFFDKQKNTKELADFIIKIEDHLISFQIERKEDVKDAESSKKNDIQRIEKKIKHGLSQLDSTWKELKASIVRKISMRLNKISISLLERNYMELLFYLRRTRTG